MASEQLLKGLLSYPVFGGSKRILPRLRSAVTPASAHFQGLQGTMTNLDPITVKDQIRHT